jgi:two-component system sensor histidine kinase TctE
MLLFDEIDLNWFSVMQSGRVLAGEPDLPLTGTNVVSYRRGEAYNAHYQQQEIRLVRVTLDQAHGDPVTVLMAETLRKRQTAERELWVLLWPIVALVVAAAAAIALAVRRTVRPLETVATRWNQQSHNSLEPIGVDDVPRELLGFASAHNELLARIRTLLARERQFAATAAHQLRTSLTGLQLGLARALEAPDTTSMRQVIRELGGSTQLSARLVQQLLTFGALDPEARGDLDLQPTDLVALAQDVGATHVEQALAKSIDLELVAPAQPLRVAVQPELLADALSNLLDNAIRYTPEGGRVLVEFEADPPAIRVSDSGPGISEDERDIVLERFVRGRNATGDGSGLGLAIAREVMAMHGAEVLLGDSPWGGLAATLLFPAGSGELRSSSPGAGPARSPRRSAAA